MTDSARVRIVPRDNERQSEEREVRSIISGPHISAETVICYRCGGANGVRRRFCSQCGAVLWKQCPKCNADCATNESFCGECGEDLAAVERALIKQHEQQLADVQAMIQRFELNEALLVLRTLAGQQTHPCLEDVNSETRQLLDLVSAERDRMVQLAAGVVDRARQMDEAADYQAAIVQLEMIPPPMRDESARRLLAVVQRKAQQVVALKQQVRTANGMDVLDRLSKIGELLQLCPRDEQVEKWAQQLRDHACKIAVRKLKQHDYEAAVMLLDAIPHAAGAKIVDDLRRRIAELAYLTSEMELAPTVSDYSVQAVKRLLQLDPDNEPAKRCLAEMQKRRQESAQDAAGHGVSWKDCPRKTHVGVAVEHESIRDRTPLRDASVAHEFNQYPGRYTVACGLALQALGRAAIGTNMLPRESPTLLDRLRTPLVPRPVRRGWGLDLGGTGLQAVCLTLNENDQPVIERCMHVPHRQPLAHAQDRNQRIALALHSLRRFASTRAIEPDDRVAAQVSAARMLARFLSVPNAPEKKLKDLVRYEVRHQIPFPLQDVCLDSHVFPSIDLPVGIGQRDGLVLAMRIEEAEQRRTLFRQAEIPVHVLQADVVAVHNWICHELFTSDHAALPMHDPRGVAVIDLGHERTNILFSFPNAIWFRTVTPAGFEIGRTLVERFQFTHEVAYEMLHQPTKARRLDELHEVRCRMFNQIAQHYERSRYETQKRIAGFQLEKLFVTGEEGRMPGLIRYLRFGR